MATAVLEPVPGPLVQDVKSKTDDPCLVVTKPVAKPSAFMRNISITLSIVQLVALVLYLGFTVHNALQSSSPSLALLAVHPLVFAVIQVFDYFGLLTDHALSLLSIFKGRKHDRPDKLLTGTTGFPGIDVIITTCGEDIDIVWDTILACLDLDYPKHKFRVFIADDGANSRLRYRVSTITSYWSNLFYFSRPMEDHKGWKAGNINHLVDLLDGKKPFTSALSGVNPWICIVDADMIPDRRMLRTLMAHCIEDDQVALATLPQEFYNIPVNDPLHQNMILQHQQDQLSRDKLDAAWCPGTGFIVRVAAWKDVGKFPEWTICEDVIFGWFLNGRGWKTIHVNQILQCGLQPDSMAGHIKQRRKWWVGGTKNGRKLGFGFGDSRLDKLSSLQSMAIRNQCPKAYLSTIVRFIWWVMVFFYLLVGQPVIGVGNGRKLQPVFFWYFVYLATTRYVEIMTMRVWGHGNLRRRQEVAVWQGMHLTKAVIQELLPDTFGGINLPFAITGSSRQAEEINERDAKHRPGMYARVVRLHQDHGILYHFGFAVIMAGLVSFRIWCLLSNSDAIERHESGGVWLQLFCSVLFPGLRLEQLVAFTGPIRYAMFPPSMLERRRYMEQDQATGGYRPKAEAKGVTFTRITYWLEVPHLMAFALAGLALWVARSMSH